MYFACLIASIFFTMYGVIVIKWRLNEVIPSSYLSNIQENLILTFTDIFVLSGLFSALISSLFWMIAMSKLDISWAHPITVGSIVVLTTLSGALIFNENIGPLRVAGTLTVILGILIIVYEDASLLQMDDIDETNATVTE